MSDQCFQEISVKDFPVSFRVIGFGEKSKILIPKINSLNYPGVKAFNHEDSEIVPEDEDLMVILLNPSNKDIQYFSKSFYQAGILTLIISTRDLSKIQGCFDSYTKIPLSNFFLTMKGILDPIFHFGPISFDFNDIKLTLKDSGKFLVKTFISGSNDELNKSLSDEISQELKEFDYENLSFILSYDNESQKPLLTSEIKNFQDFLRSLPENVNIIWGIQNDEKLKQDQTQVIILKSGKNLKL